jgi:hypothetical protein
VSDSSLDDDSAFVWRRSISTVLLLIALGFAFFALSAARMLVDKEVGLRYGALFMAVSLLLVCSAVCSWLGRSWLTAGLVLASIIAFVYGMPDR